MLVVLMFVTALARGTTNDLSGLLQKGLFEEEANRNLGAATAAYQTLVLQFDKDRQIGATAIFRLGEVYRKQGKTNEAAVQYERIVHDFAEQTTLVTLSRQNLTGLNKRSENLEPKASPKDFEVDVVELKKLPRAELLQVFPSLVPDQLLMKLLEQLSNTEIKKTESINNLGENHPDIKRIIAVEKELNQQIDERITGMLKALELRSAASGAGKSTAAVTTVVDDEEAEIRRIQAMIRNSPDLINASSGEGGMTPLHTAARQGQLTVARFLLDNGANVNSKDGNNRTSLTLSATAGHKAMAELLLSKGAEVNARAAGGRTPLHIAASMGFGGVAEVLLAHKANVNASSNDGGMTPLHLAAGSGHSALMELLLRNRADANAVDNGGKTPLMYASQGGHALAVKVLLSAEAEVNAQTTSGTTALSYAAGNGHLEVVKALLAAKADPNAGILDTPLTVALPAKPGAKHLEIAEALLRAGANPNLGSKLSSFLQPPAGPSFTAPFSAAGYGPYHPLQIATARGGVEVVKLLLKYKADANAKELGWYSPAQPLVVYTLNNTEMLKAFLEGGADPDSKDRDGVTLIASAAKSYPAALEPLISYKANVNVGDENGNSPLHWAALRGDEKFVHLLLTAKADVNARSRASWTPLHSAVAGGDAKIVKLLLTNNADVNVRSSDGQTPLDFAKASAAPRPAAHPGSLPSPGGIPRPTLQQPAGAKSSATEEPVNLADLLRQHGALDELPDFKSIRITRQGLAQPLMVFSKRPKLTNQFTLLETVMSFYAKSSSIVNNRVFTPLIDLPFPDFGRIIIRRPSPQPGGKEKEIKVSLLNSSNVVDCAKDVPVEFGDVIEIPERVHALNEPPLDPVREMERTFMEANRATLPERQLRGGPDLETNVVMLTIRAQEAARKADAQRLTCLRKTIQLIVAGERTSFTVDSWKEGFLNQALARTEARSALRSSSDLSRVKVTRKDANTGKPVVLTEDATDAKDSLWLQDGDVIEVPDKP